MTGPRLRPPLPSLLLGLLAVAAPEAGRAGVVVPVGVERQVNVATLGFQSDPAVAGRPGGDFVVVWQGPSPTGRHPDDIGILARFVAADGLPKGAEFTVNTFTPAVQRAWRRAWR